MIHLYEGEKGGSDISTARVPALIVQASQFTLFFFFFLKYRLHMVAERNTLFSNIVKRLERLGSKVGATC